MPQETLYERQDLINGLRIPKVASVVGCGGTGFWTAVFIAMSGVEELILVDSDHLEVSNLNRLPFNQGCVGAKKANATMQFIKAIRPQIRIEAQLERIQKPQDCLVLRGDVFCCTDNLKSQQIICAYCKKNNLPYQRIGYDGTILNVSKTFPLSFAPAREEDGYTVTPSWVVPAALAAAAGVSSRLYKELCLMDDLGKLHIQGCSHICPKILDVAREKGEQEILDNISDHIPDDYGYCPDCDYVPEGYAYCDDCEKRYSESDMEEKVVETREIILAEINNDNIAEDNLLDAIMAWCQRNKKKEKKLCKAKTAISLT